MLVVMRRFWIQKDSFDEFERLSREEIWPAIEAAGARILGMFRAEEPHPNDEVTEPCDMVVLLTQYIDKDHWLATRARQDSWRGPEDVRSKLANGGRATSTHAGHASYLHRAGTRQDRRSVLHLEGRADGEC